MGVLITPMALAHPLHPIWSKSRYQRRNLWVGWCVSSWRPWFWPVYSIYYIHIILHSCNLSKWKKKLFQRDIHTKSWCGHAVGVLDDMILLSFSVWFQKYISFVSFNILYIMIWMYHVPGTMWHCDLVSFTVYRTVLGYALFWCWVSLGAPFTISLIWFYFIIVTIMGIFMIILYFLNYTLRN